MGVELNLNWIKLLPDINTTFLCPRNMILDLVEALRELRPASVRLRSEQHSFDIVKRVLLASGNSLTRPTFHSLDLYADSPSLF